MKLRIVTTVLALLAAAVPASSEGVLAALEKEVRALSDRVALAIVRVEAGQERQVRLRPELRLEFPAAWSEARVGTGFVVGAKGRILTSHSIVADASKLTVRFHDREPVPARLVATDAFFRVAVLEAEVPSTVRPLELAGDEPGRGSLALLCGNAHDQGPSLVLGLVCGVRRPLFGFDRFTVVSTPLTPGDSGAPILGIDGRVIGMASAALAGRSGAATSLRGSGSGFTLRPAAATGVGALACGVPAADLRRVLTEVEAHGRVRTSWLGVTLAERAPEVRIVVSRSPASEGGIQPGDRILALGDRTVASRVDLSGALARTDPGETVVVKVLREGDEKVLTVRLVARPDRESDDLIEVEGGVQILVVAPRSAASRLPLKPGDVIVAVDGKPATSADGVREALTRFESERRIDLRVVRGEFRFHIDYRGR